MNIESNKEIFLEKVIGSKNQIDILFKLLIKRKHNISNVSTPSYQEHVKFVKKNPYRAWYLIIVNDLYIGSAYIMRNNCISISLEQDTLFFSNVLKLLFRKHKPLPKVKSLRPPYFYLNIAPKNKETELELIKIGATKIQLTYSLEHLTTNFLSKTYDSN